MKKRYRQDYEGGVAASKDKLLKEQISFLHNRKINIIDVKKGNVTVYIGDVIKVLSLLPDNIVDCVVTSPPYWRQRDYKDSLQIGQENSYLEYIKRLVGVFNAMKRVLKPTGTFFLNVGYKYQSKELLLIPELLAVELQKNGWTLLNKIIWHKPNAMPSSLNSRFSNVYEPIFLFVKEESKYRYYLSIDDLRLPVTNFSNNKKPEDLIGIKVENSLLRAKNVKGRVYRVFNDGEGNIFVRVKWDINSTTTEVVNDFHSSSQISICLICPDCGKTISHEIDIYDHVNCREFPKPLLPKIPGLDDKKEIISINKYSLTSVKKHYDGKYVASPESRGASPGARKSLFGEYLVIQRRYKIFQSIIADYLKFWKQKRGITTKEVDRILGYRDTAGHWFRKDSGSWGRGGSIPLPDDWYRLKNVLKFDNIYDRWVTDTHLVLQTVKAHPKGRNPGDVWKIKLQPLSEAHFATFPEELVERCIKAGSPEMGTILDPFAGSGTTGKVAEDLGKNVLLIELIPRYLDIIRKRCKSLKEVIYVK